ncbi:MAG: hypothetical protein OEZ01_04320 [Candidatus Heimdallarchaeota archaeon]|nr:hypothetical protein [Candidatus Heimdallarchaeota archaeon]
MEPITINKIVRLGTVKIYDNKHATVYCKIKFKDGRLSITGVEGPYTNGNCAGSCGQINIHLTKKQETIKLNPAWNKSMLAKFFNVWDEWHLNDLNPNCEHQIGPAWTRKNVTLYHFELNKKTENAILEAKKQALQVLKDGNLFKPTKHQIVICALKSKIIHHTDKLPKTLNKYYAPCVKKYDWQVGPQEIKSTNRLTEEEHPEGFMSKPCKVCGYKYGHGWKFKKVPEDIISFLKNLPTTDRIPAWV